MTDLLGPGSNTINVVTTRPAETRIFTADDTWCKDCSSPEINDGTRLTAPFLNSLLAQVRGAIRGRGVTEDNTDDEMLLNAINSTVVGYMREADFSAASTIFPEMRPGGLVARTVSAGQIVVSASQSIIWKGFKTFSFDAFTILQRTFSTSPNTTYHLRWYAPGAGFASPAISFPAGRLMLLSLADIAYNPSLIAEASGTFDTTPDSALLARVVTNGSNILTVTPLLNLPFLYSDSASFYDQTTPGAFDLISASFGFACTHNFFINWSRRPKIIAPIGHIGIDITNSSFAPGYIMNGSSNVVTLASISRYFFTARVFGDWREPVPADFSNFFSTVDAKVIG
jgi:hypothetical protein